MIVATTQPYEILLRFDANGRLQGGHYRTLTTLADDQTGKVYAATEDDPVPIADAIAANPTLAAYLGPAASAITVATANQAAPVGP